jgi:hypothetical protein
MSDSNVVQTSGVGGALLLITGVVLVILKMQGIITVSWWIVLIPLYPAIVGLGFLGVMLVFLIIVGICLGIKAALGG